MPDKPKKTSGPGAEAKAPHETAEFLALRKQLEEQAEATDKLQKSYDNIRSLDNRKDQELSNLRTNNARLEELMGTTGSDLQAEDRRKLAREEAQEADRLEAARVGFMVRRGVDQSGLDEVESYVREHEADVTAYDKHGRFDYNRIFNTAHSTLENQRREEKLRKFEEVESKAREAQEKHNNSLRAQAGIVGAAAGEGEQTLDVSKMSSDEMKEQGLVPGFEGVPDVRKG